MIKNSIKTDYKKDEAKHHYNLSKMFHWNVERNGETAWVAGNDGTIGGVVGSWALGAFFMLPLLIPSSISSTEERLTGVNQSAMYFAGQALFTCVIGAIATGVYDAIKNLFVSRDFSQILMVDAELMESVNIFTAREAAAAAMGLPVGEVFCLGTMLVPIIVSILF